VYPGIVAILAMGKSSENPSQLGTVISIGGLILCMWLFLSGIFLFSTFLYVGFSLVSWVYWNRALIDLHDMIVPAILLLACAVVGIGWESQINTLGFDMVLLFLAGLLALQALLLAVRSRWNGSRAWPNDLTAILSVIAIGVAIYRASIWQFVVGP